jgi:tetratricopeptide (TPR) repeat protein
MLQIRYNERGDVRDLDEAIQKAKEAVAAVPAGHTALAMFLHGLGTKLGARFDLSGNVKGLYDARQKLEQALQLISENNIDFAAYSTNLGKCFEMQLDQSKNPEDLAKATQMTERALASIPENHPDLGTTLIHHVNKVVKKFVWTGSSEAVGYIQEARALLQRVPTSPENSAEYSEYLESLGNVLEKRFEQTENRDDLEQAIRNAREVLKMTPSGSVRKPAWLSNLGDKLERRFEEFGYKGDLEEAIGLTLHALKMTPEHHIYRGAYLNSLGNQLERMFELTGKMECLEDAIQQAESAVKSVAESHIDLPAFLTHLGNKLQRRFEWTGNTENLKDAIFKVEQAADALTGGVIKLPSTMTDLLPGIWYNLAKKLEMFYERTGDEDFLENAIFLAEETLVLFPMEHPARPMCLSSLARKLRMRALKTKTRDGLDRAVEKAEQAVKATSTGDPRRAVRLQSLSGILRARFERFGDNEDSRRALSCADQAVKLTPTGHTNMSLFLLNYANCLYSSPEPNDRHQALGKFLESLESENGMPFDRLESAFRAIHLLKHENPQLALQTARKALEIFPIVSTHSLSRGDLQTVVSAFAGLASDACALSLKLEEPPSRALELLESGRGVVTGLLLDNRRDISGLQAQYPEWAAMFDRLRTQMNLPISADEALDVATRRKRRLATGKEFQDCIRDIRRLPGQKRFLMTPPAEELQGVAEKGPIVIINISDMRSDAVIVSTSSIRPFLLPTLTSSETTWWLRQNLTKPENLSDIGRKNKKYSIFLSWLWTKCVQPLLRELGMHKPQFFSPLPRIWWIGEGVASFLPFHAAGEYTSGSTENMFHKAISS